VLFKVVSLAYRSSLSCPIQVASRLCR
jgi:hypothetical protein